MVEDALKDEQVLFTDLKEEKEGLMLDTISSVDRRVLESNVMGNLVHTVDNDVDGIQAEMDHTKAQAI